MYKTVLFDLDGTLTDPGIGITNSVMYALDKWNIKVDNRTELYKFIGPPLYDSFRKYYGFSHEDAERAIAYYREYFGEKGLYENEVYDGIKELLATLKSSGKRLVLATSKPEVYAKKILEHFALDVYFSFIGGASMDSSRNKKSAVIAYALDNIGIAELSDAVMIGDREHDIIGAKDNGIDSIGVLYGYGDRKELVAAGATHIVETPVDILSLC